jgi:hypothetical protein
MTNVKVLKHELLSLKGHPEIDEAWVHEQIKSNPSILGLGDDVTLRDHERRQSKAGRLDLLLENKETEPTRWYELEVQLGASDESHIIRCIEYWDIERRKHLEYDHIAVLAAEDITSRFFNVIQLFNRAIPIIALRIVALKVGDGLVLHFVKILDETAHRPGGDAEAPPADKGYWEKTASRESMHIVDTLFQMLTELNPKVQPHFTQSYIVPRISSANRWFLYLEPKKNFVGVSIKYSSKSVAENLRESFQKEGIETKLFDEATIKFRLTSDALQERRSFLKDALKEAYDSDQQ